MPAKKTLPNLESIHYLEVLNPTMMKKWLTNTAAYQPWKDAVYMVADNDKQEDQLMDLTIRPKYYENIDPIVLGKAVKEYVDTVLNDWTEDSTDESARQLVASLPLFVEMSKTLPHVNPSDKYKFAFRGTGISDKTLMQFIKNNQEPGDWVKTKIESRQYMAYKGPKKRMFNYKPHRMVQSWSTSEKAASNFGSQIIATPIDTTFFFDPEFMNQYGFKWENETVHFGKEPMKVALLVDKETYDLFMDKLLTPAERRKKKSDPANATFESDYDQYMANTYTDGDKLMWQISSAWAERASDGKGWAGGDTDWYDKHKANLAKEKKMIGDKAFKKKYTDYYKKLKATIKESTTNLNETVEIQDEEGTLTMPL
jgi:hypothetical protein